MPMDTTDGKMKQMHTFDSRGFQIRRSGYRTRTLLFAAVVVAFAQFPETAGFHNVYSGLSTALASPAPANTTTDFDWQSVS